MAERISSLTAKVEKVDVVEQIQDNADMLTKGIGFLTSRISILGQGQHAEYTIFVTWDGKSHRIRKRFSEFSALHDMLRDRFPNGLTFDLPTKTPIRFFSPEALDDRKNSLNAYLKELCRYNELINCFQVQSFFGIGSQGAGGWGGDSRAVDPREREHRSRLGGGYEPSGGYGGGYESRGDPREREHRNSDRMRPAERYEPAGGYENRGSYRGSGGYGADPSSRPGAARSAPQPELRASQQASATAAPLVQGAPPTRHPQTHQADAEDSGDDLAGWDR